MALMESIFGLQQQELAEALESQGEPAFRSKQLFSWLYRRMVVEPSYMSNLPVDLRRWLAATYSFKLPEIAAEEHALDGTTKYRLRLADGEAIECVAMPEEKGAGISLCLSSQVGCALGCDFCMTGSMGLRRNLEAAEIVVQVVLALSRLPESPSTVNLLLMGMGEPLLNVEAVVKALAILADRDGMSIPMRRIVVSTAGIPEGILRLYSEPALPDPPRLAVSLNAPNQKLRERLMPVATRYPLEELVATLRGLPRRRDRVTVEYVMLRGVNDSPEQAAELATLLQGLPIKVNLIPLNESERIQFNSPEEKAVEAFLATLVEAGFHCTVRRSRGRELSAACGQLVVE